MRARAALAFPLLYLVLVSISAVMAFADQMIGLAILQILSVPWSVPVLFFLAWAMMHDDGMRGLGTVLFLAGALINLVVIYKIANEIQYHATIGKE